MSVKRENRYRKLVIDQGRIETDRQREFEAAFIERGTRNLPATPRPAARRRDVRAWMRQNSGDYETATHLAEAANVVFRLPGDGLDDGCHWVWDEAFEAIDGGR